MTTTVLERDVENYNAEYGDGSNGGAVRWCQDMLGSIYWSKQIEIIEAVWNYPRVAVKACHGSSKTFTVADVVLAFLFLCIPSKVITTAPTWHQVRDLLWSEIRIKYAQNLVDDMPGIECLQTRIEIDPDWFAVGLSSDDTDKFTGIHQKNILIAVDEAPGVSADIIEGAETLMAGGNARMIKIGNPVNASGHFYNNFRSGAWHKISIGYKDTPNFAHPPFQKNPDPRDVNLPQEIKDQLITPAWVEWARDEWGEDSPLFTARAKGEFPKDDGRAVIPLALCENAVNRELEAEGDMVLGVDVGAGGDLTAYARRRGQVVLDVTTLSTPESSEVVQRILEMNYRDKYKLINVDSCGIGWGVVGRLKELGLPVVGINAASAANDKEHYLKKRDELWFGGREWLKYGKIPNDERLIADLTGPIQLPLSPTGQQRVESKEDTKKRLKARSPDPGDAFLLCIQSGSSEIQWY